MHFDDEEDSCLFPGICVRPLSWFAHINLTRKVLEFVRSQATGIYKDLNGNDMQALPLSTVEDDLTRLSDYKVLHQHYGVRKANGH
jgi:hypothetical protein